MTMYVAAGSAGNPILNISIFAVFVAATLFVVYRAGIRNTTAADYYAAGNAFTGAQNGVALAGEYLSAASFLGVAGAIAVHGYDGFLYSVGFLVTWLITLVLVAEMVRNSGRFTMGDVIVYRMRQRPVRAAAASSTLVIVYFVMMAQMAGAGGLVAFLLDIRSRSGQAIIIVVVGIVMICYVLVGGMKGTTWVQIIKAVLLMACMILTTMFLMGKFGYNFSTLLDKARNNNPLGAKFLNPGGQYGKNGITKLDFVSQAIGFLLGVSGRPDVLMRLYTVPNSREARRSVAWTIWIVMVFYLAAMVIGFGATALVGSNTIVHSPGGENSATPLLALHIGGPVLLGLVSAVAFATILSVIAAVTLTASASFAHDVYANVIKRGHADPRSEVRVARFTAVAIGCLAVAGGILAIGQNVAFMVTLALAISASANVPTIIFSLFWKRFNTSGTLWSIYTGLISCLVLIVFSPLVSGSSTSLISSVDFHWFPLSNPGIVAVPLSFAAGILGTFFGQRNENPEKQAEMEVRALTGIGSGLRG
jgi:cation/acetate symporter